MAADLLWSKGTNDFFEARIAAQRVPEGQELQFAIAGLPRQANDDVPSCWQASSLSPTQAAIRA